MLVVALLLVNCGALLVRDGLPHLLALLLVDSVASRLVLGPVSGLRY